MVQRQLQHCCKRKRVLHYHGCKPLLLFLLPCLCLLPHHLPPSGACACPACLHLPPDFRPPSPPFRSLHVLLTGDDESKEALRAMGSVQLLVGLVR